LWVEIDNLLGYFLEIFITRKKLHSEFTLQVAQK
jgi:hypothetical protein